MKRISFFILALVYVFATNAQTFGTKHNIDVQIGTINGINYEYFLNKDMSVGAFVNVPLGFNLYFKSADAVNASPNFYTHGLNVGGFFTKYWGVRDIHLSRKAAGGYQEKSMLVCRGKNFINQKKWKMPMSYHTK